MKQTPLEIALTKIKNCCCNNCEWLVKIEDINYCRSCGKIILEMHLDSNREVQCKDVFKRKEDFMIDPSEWRIDVISKTFVKITHIPSGITVTKQGKSQIKTNSEAMEEIILLVELWEGEKSDETV